MKRLIYLFIFASLAALLLGGCEFFTEPEPPGETEMTAAAIAPITKVNVAQDTLTNAETEVFSLVTVNSPAEYEIGIAADSISGTTTATCYLYQNIDFGASDKYRIETITVNHAPYRYRETGTVVGGILTCECTSTGTQVTHVRVDLNLVPRTP